MINRRLYIHKFCNNSEILLSFSWLIFIRALVFSFSRRANFSSFESCVSTNFSIHSYLVHSRVKAENNYIITKIEKFQLCFIICFATTNHSHIFSYSIINCNAMTSETQTKDNLRRKILGKKFKGFFITVHPHIKTN